MPCLISVFLRLSHSFPEPPLNHSLQFDNGFEDAIAKHLMFDRLTLGCQSFA
jgi:hypothetical protein